MIGLSYTEAPSDTYKMLIHQTLNSSKGWLVIKSWYACKVKINKLNKNQQQQQHEQQHEQQQQLHRHQQ